MADDSSEPHVSQAQSAYGPEDWIAFLLFWALTAIVFLQFSARYLGLGSFPWTEEGARYLLILLAFAGGALVIRRRSHVAMTMFHARLSPKARSILTIIIALINVGFFAMAAWLTWQVSLVQGAQRMASINLPLRHLYWAVAFFLAAMAIRAAIQTVRDLATTPAGR